MLRRFAFRFPGHREEEIRYLERAPRPGDEVHAEDGQAFTVVETRRDEAGGYIVSCTPAATYRVQEMRSQARRGVWTAGGGSDLVRDLTQRARDLVRDAKASLERARFAGRSSGKASLMANPVPIGSDVSSGTYRCTNCGNELDTTSVKHLPPCPSCGGPNEWEPLSGGDSANDPYPDSQ